MRTLDEAVTTALEKNAKGKCYLHCTLTNTHTHAHTHTVAKGDRASAKAFFEVSALEPS